MWLESNSYIGIVVLELGIFACYLVLNPKAARRRLEEQQHAIQSESGTPTASTAAAAAQGGHDIEAAHRPTNKTTPEWSRHTTWDEKSPPLCSDSPTNRIDTNHARLPA